MSRTAVINIRLTAEEIAVIRQAAQVVKRQQPDDNLTAGAATYVRRIAVSHARHLLKNLPAEQAAA